MALHRVQQEQNIWMATVLADDDDLGEVVVLEFQPERWWFGLDLPIVD